MKIIVYMLYVNFKVSLCLTTDYNKGGREAIKCFSAFSLSEINTAGVFNKIAYEWNFAKQVS